MEKNEFNEVAKKVIVILTDNHAARDDDRLLMTRIWIDELCAANTSSLSFFTEFMNKRLSHPETISRARRKVQEENVSLRGKNWNLRHKRAESFCHEMNGLKLMSRAVV